MRVLVFTNTYPYNGDPSYGIFVKEQVDALRKEGVKVDVLFINARYNKFNYISGINQLIRKCHRNKYDLIHVHHTFCAAIALLQRNIPVILTFHEGEASATLKMKLREIIHRPYKFLVFSLNLKKLIIKLVDEVIFVTRQHKNLFGINKGVVIPCGINFNLFKPIPIRLARSKIGLRNDKNFVLFPSTPKAVGKRVDIAEEAIRMIKNRGVDVELILLDNIPHNEVQLYMNACDAMIFTSDYEASPMVIKEAMACNIPIVSVDVGDVGEIFRDTNNCYLCQQSSVDIANKLITILENREKNRKRTKGREAIQHFNLQKVTHLIMEIYKNTVKAGRLN